jgi:hypothetical protein
MKNKLFEIFVCMLLVGTFFVVVPYRVSAEQEGNYIYTVSNGEATITGYTGPGGAITIPATLDKHPTVAIGKGAFNSNNGHLITSVIIPGIVNTIGDNAFYGCSSLTSITIPNSVTTIGDNAFHSCSALTSVAIPDSITTIGDNAFYGCSSLTSVTIGNNVNTIGIGAFSLCPLTSVTIPNSVTTIGDNAFFHCTPLISVTIPDSVTTIGDYGFSGCANLTSVTIGNSVTSIGHETFSHCSSLSSITFRGLIAPTTVGIDWILFTPTKIRGHAYADSNFPDPPGVWNGLTMSTIIGGENKLPLAAFTWTPSNPTLNQMIAFNASESNDQDGSITLNEWDWNNDGVYEESHTAPSAAHSWAQAGNYSVTLRVTDNDGATSTKTITIPVSSVKPKPPGFELIFVIIAIAVSILLWKKKRDR